MKTRLALAITLATALMLALFLVGCGEGHHTDTFTGYNKGTRNVIEQERRDQQEMAEFKRRDAAFMKVYIVIQFQYKGNVKYDPLEYESYSVTEKDYDSYPYSFSGTVTLRDESGEEWISEWSMQIEVDDSAGNAVPVKDSVFFGEPYKAED